MKGILSKVNKKIYFIIPTVILIILICILSFTGIINRINENSKKARTCRIRI